MDDIKYEIINPLPVLAVDYTEVQAQELAIITGVPVEPIQHNKLTSSYPNFYCDLYDQHSTITYAGLEEGMPEELVHFRIWENRQDIPRKSMFLKQKQPQYCPSETQGFGSIYFKNLELFYLLVTCQAFGIYSKNPADLLEKLGITYSEAQLCEGIPAGHFTRFKNGENNNVRFARGATHHRDSAIYPNEYWGVGLIKYKDGFTSPHNVSQKFNHYVDARLYNYWRKTYQVEERAERDYHNFISKV